MRHLSKGLTTENTESTEILLLETLQIFQS